MKEKTRHRLAFDLYVRMGSGRSLESLSELLQGNPSLIGLQRGPSRSTLDVWSSAFHWQDRLLDLEHEAAEQDREKQLEFQREMNERHAEGFEMGEIGFYRGQVRELCHKAAEDQIEGVGLEHLYWKTGTGDHIIAQRILEATAVALARRAGHRYDEMDEDEKRSFCETIVRAELVRLSSEGKFRILMPRTPARHRQVISNLFGVEPLPVPEIGSKRYLAINRRVVVIGLPVPPGVGKRRGANVALITDDIDRVHECLAEFDSIWATYGPPPS